MTIFDNYEVKDLNNLDILAKQVVEGFIIGLHKPPFHGFSVEFAEHRIYNPGEAMKNIDWKVFARTDKMFTKRYEEETNLRCHILLDVRSTYVFSNFCLDLASERNIMSYLVPSEFVTKMVDAGESKIFMSTRDTLIRAFMAGAILALAAAFAITINVQTGQPLAGAAWSRR